MKDDAHQSASRKFDNSELEKLFNENPIQFQKELTKRLGIIRQIISIRLKQFNLCDKILSLERKELICTLNYTKHT